MIVKKIRAFIRWVLVAFFGSTILAVVAFRFIPVFITPLMVIRCVQQVKMGKEIKMRHDWVPIDQIARHLPMAVMASEDARFLEHHGFDFKAIEHAVERNVKHPEKQKLGASTISQQTAKNVFLWPGRSWLRKGFEVYFTGLVELMWSKERIMEVYLNSIEMGDGIYGAQAVAKEHFGCEAKDLSRAQSALIAASLPNPIRFNSQSPSRYMYRRQARILREMKYVERVNSEFLK